MDVVEKFAEVFIATMAENDLGKFGPSASLLFIALSDRFVNSIHFLLVQIDPIMY